MKDHLIEVAMQFRGLIGLLGLLVAQPVLA